MPNAPNTAVVYFRSFRKNVSQQEFEAIQQHVTSSCSSAGTDFDNVTSELPLMRLGGTSPLQESVDTLRFYKQLFVADRFNLTDTVSQSYWLQALMLIGLEDSNVPETSDIFDLTELLNDTEDDDNETASLLEEMQENSGNLSGWRLVEMSSIDGMEREDIEDGENETLISRRLRQNNKAGRRRTLPDCTCSCPVKFVFGKGKKPKKGKKSKKSKQDTCKSSTRNAQQQRRRRSKDPFKASVAFAGAKQGAEVSASFCKKTCRHKEKKCVQKCDRVKCAICPDFWGNVQDTDCHHEWSRVAVLGCAYMRLISFVYGRQFYEAHNQGTKPGNCDKLVCVTRKVTQKTFMLDGEGSAPIFQKGSFFVKAFADANAFAEFTGHKLTDFGGCASFGLSATLELIIARIDGQLLGEICAKQATGVAANMMPAFKVTGQIKGELNVVLFWVFSAHVEASLTLELDKLGPTFEGDDAKDDTIQLSGEVQASVGFFFFTIETTISVNIIPKTLLNKANDIGMSRLGDCKHTDDDWWNYKSDGFDVTGGTPDIWICGFDVAPVDGYYEGNFQALPEGVATLMKGWPLHWYTGMKCLKLKYAKSGQEWLAFKTRTTEELWAWLQHPWYPNVGKMKRLFADVDLANGWSVNYQKGRKFSIAGFLCKA
jgi:hypothetical protein